MQYREIVAVTGQPGLYQLLTTKSDGAIVRNIADKTTKFISARKHNVTPLESIEVYTTGENIRLNEVFQKMAAHEATTPLADARTNDSRVIKGYFDVIYPELDKDRVYLSDMKKMLKWYELLKLNDLLKFEQEAAGSETEEPDDDEEAEYANEIAEDQQESADADTLPQPSGVAQESQEASAGVE